MKTSKLPAALLAAVIAGSSLFACGESASSPQPGASENDGAAAQAAAEAEQQ